MTKTEQFLDAINDLPDELILEAGEHRARRRTYRRALRTALIAAALAMLLSVTAYAAGGSLAGQHNSPKPGMSWSSLSKLPKAERALGLAVTVPERFESGFIFQKMNLSCIEITDDAGNVMETYPELNVRYDSGESTFELNIMAERPQPHNGAWTTYDYEGVTLWCESFTYMAVPENYRETEEDLRRKERGELMIGWGADTIEILPSSFVQFTLDGALYNLLSMDGTEAETLCAMAEEIIRTNRGA